MDLGTGIALGSLFVAAGGSLCYYVPNRKRDGNSNSTFQFRRNPDTCPAHSGFEARLENLKEGQERIEGWVRGIAGKLDGLRMEEK